MTALQPLWQIEENLLALLDTVAMAPEDQQPEIQQEIADYLGREAAKVDQIAHVLAALEWEQKCAADEIARLQERKKVAAAAQDRLEQYVCRAIAMRGEKRLTGATNTLSVRHSDAVVIRDASLIPAQYVREKVTHEPDKAAIKAAMKDGADVPGADLVSRENLVRK